MSWNVGGIFHDATTKEEASGTLTSLASYVSPNPSALTPVWTATTASPTASGAMASVVLTDSERNANAAVKFTSSRSDVEDLIVVYGAEGNLYARSGEDPVRCARSGIYFPASRIRTDRSGKRMADRFFVEEPAEWPY